MGTFLYFFWDGFSDGGTGSGLIGQWSNVQILQSTQPTLELYASGWVTLGSTNERIEVDLP